MGTLHQSIARFGFVSPIIIDERTGQLVAGHGRLDALQQMKTTGQPPPERIISKNGEWLVPVIRGVTFKDTTEAEAYALADNRLVEAGGWDEEALATVLSDLAAQDALQGIGWDRDDVDQILRDLGMLEVPEDPGAQLNRADELQVRWKVKTGDVWEIPSNILPGKTHMIMCGDSTKKEDVENLMVDKVAQYMVTDPPYGVAYQTDGKNPRGRKDNTPLANDALGSNQKEFWVSALNKYSLEGDAYIFSPSGPLIFILDQAIQESGIEHHQWLIWVKQRFVLGRSHYHYRHEHIFYGWKDKSSWQNSRDQGSVWEEDNQMTSPEHPTMKPVALCQRAIINSSSSNGLIIDPFLGSGTTVVAAEQLGRICYGMEIEPKYVAVALQRLADMGLEPRLANG